MDTAPEVYGLCWGSLLILYVYRFRHMATTRESCSVVSVLKILCSACSPPPHSSAFSLCGYCLLMHRILSFHEVQFICFFSIALAFSVPSIKSSSGSVLGSFGPVSSFKSCTVLGFTFRSLIHLVEGFCTWCEVGVQCPGIVCWRYIPSSPRCVVSWPCQTLFDSYACGLVSGLCLLFCGPVAVCGRHTAVTTL